MSDKDQGFITALDNLAAELQRRMDEHKVDVIRYRLLTTQINLCLRLRYEFREEITARDSSDPAASGAGSCAE